MRAFRSLVVTVTSIALVVQVPLVALAGSAEFAPGSDESARRCDALAASPYDRQYTGTHVPVTAASVEEALRVCRQAAEAEPVRARYRYQYGRALWMAERYDEAAQQFGMARGLGNAWAAMGLGALAAHGTGVPRDPANAMALYREAAAAGVAPAEYNIGELYEFGAGVARDPAEAARHYRRAADAEVSVAYAGLMYLALAATPPDYGEVVRWAQKAADADIADGALVLGWCYLVGLGVSRDVGLAVRSYDAAARLGSTEAMVRLGLMWRDGIGVRKDPRAATAWLRRAAEQGDTGGQLELARTLLSGMGVERDARTAYQWAFRAGQAGMVPAQVLVAAMLYDGDGVVANHAAAAAWFGRAAEKGDTFSMWRLGWAFRDGDGVARNPDEAVRWFRMGADRGHTDSEEALGELYMDAHDYRTAAYWLERAVAKGDDAARVNLGLLLANGWGVPRDTARARELFAQATQSADPRFARQARQNLAAMTGRPMPGSSRDDTGAVVATALVGLALLAIFSNSGSSGGGGGGGGGSGVGSGMSSGMGGGGSNLGTMGSSRPVSTPMNGPITRTLHGADAIGLNGPVNRR